MQIEEVTKSKLTIAITRILLENKQRFLSRNEIWHQLFEQFEIDARSISRRQRRNFYYRWRNALISIDHQLTLERKEHLVDTTIVIKYKLS